MQNVHTLGRDILGLAGNVSNASRSQRRKNSDSLHLNILTQPKRIIQNGPNNANAAIANVTYTLRSPCMLFFVTHQSLPPPSFCKELQQTPNICFETAAQASTFEHKEQQTMPHSPPPLLQIKIFWNREFTYGNVYDSFSARTAELSSYDRD